MKFQIVSVLAALAFIAPVLAMPHDDHKHHPQKCHPHKWDCPKDYVCCPSHHDKYKRHDDKHDHHKKYYCYKGHKCPHKDHKY